MSESSGRRSTSSSIDNTDTTNTTTARTSRSIVAKQLCLNVTNDDDDINDNNNNNNNNNRSSSGIYDLTQPLLNNNILDISSASSNFTDVSPNPDDDYDDDDHYSLIRGNDVWENITLSRENSVVDTSSNPDESSSSSSSHYYMQSMWSRCSFRNALLMSLQVMIYARMITVKYTPRSEPRHHHRHRHHHRSSVNEIVVDDQKVAPTAVHPGDADGSGSCDGVNDNVILHRQSNNSSQLEPVIMSRSSALE